jgi:hypothetical protein
MADQELLDTLSCEWAKRPKAAPHFGDLAGAVRAVRRRRDALLVEYDPAELTRLTELVAAERLCCARIDWQLDGATLRIAASPEQLDLLEQVVRTP